jgi:DDE superfamily endonuclease
MAKKNQRHFYSGKKKKHTLKSQVLVDKKSQKIICNKRHDFRLFKESRAKIHPNTKVITDTGYQGLQKIHSYTSTPKKKTKKKPLSKEDKRNNKHQSSERVLNERQFNVRAIITY